jgi:transcriptional regulator with XRE-family HTH domain
LSSTEELLMLVVDSKTDEFYIAAGRRIRTVREGRGLSQAILAQRIGFTRSSVANLEAGRQRITLHLFVLIAKALGVNPDALLPDTSMLEFSDSFERGSLEEHLVGAPETTHDFVFSTVAKAPQSSNRKNS